MLPARNTALALTGRHCQTMPAASTQQGQAVQGVQRLAVKHACK
jgi:hypothetical protein